MSTQLDRYSIVLGFFFLQRFPSWLLLLLFAMWRRFFAWLLFNPIASKFEQSQCKEQCIIMIGNQAQKAFVYWRGYVFWRTCFEVERSNTTDVIYRGKKKTRTFIGMNVSASLNVKIVSWTRQCRSFHRTDKALLALDFFIASLFMDIMSVVCLLQNTAIILVKLLSRPIINKEIKPLSGQCIAPLSNICLVEVVMIVAGVVRITKKFAIHWRKMKHCC